MKRIFFTPGPSELYFTVEQHISNALKQGVASISHRSKEYVAIQQATEEALKELLNIPEGYHIGFMSSATEIWARSIENLVSTKTYHFVNGSFSEKYYKAAIAQGKEAIAQNAELGSNNDITTAIIPEGTELITLAQNETSTGAWIPIEAIEKLRNNYPDTLIALDGVSSLPTAAVDINNVDMLYFSVQKCFGLPSGLGVWIYNDRCLEKAEQLKATGKFHDTYNSILNVHKFGLKHQTSCTPNVMNIYLLGKITQDMVNKGVDQIRNEAKYKSVLIYDLFEKHEKLSPFVKEKQYRSQTVGVAEVENGATELMNKLAEKGLIVGGGYSQFKGQHIRIANFPTHSKEQMEMLVDTINDLEF
ncbi:aminotransferase class V-fold PLP-dependent enzyme [Reichenbachiella versicolor]|uniref:aminotransferase class V-fold PLP-dependent enzyme n=1 Tax=Reichenbachiella versicolor TaxID=1821036 RepID=UPI000D6E2E8C|nr:aminotransferase class V-fold PLP-dependent enzyme [Reichenbachiella versicolor]